jgi:hypothetical protein
MWVFRRSQQNMDRAFNRRRKSGAAIRLGAHHVERSTVAREGSEK